MHSSIKNARTNGKLHPPCAGRGLRGPGSQYSESARSGLDINFFLLSRSSHEQTIYRAPGVNLKLLVCGYGKGRRDRDRYQQNILRVRPLFTAARRRTVLEVSCSDCDLNRDRGRHNGPFGRGYGWSLWEFFFPEQSKTAFTPLRNAYPEYVVFRTLEGAT